MTEINLHCRDDHPDIEYIDDSNELYDALETIAPYIGRIIIEFNSLEDSVSFCIKELMSRSEAEDELMYVFLSEMGYSSKVTALINLYGQLDEKLELGLQVNLKNTEKALRDAATYRNQYAHASWDGLSNSYFALTKSKAKKTGVFNTYRKFDVSQMSKDLQSIKGAQAALEFFDNDFNERFHANIR